MNSPAERVRLLFDALANSRVSPGASLTFDERQMLERLAQHDMLTPPQDDVLATLEMRVLGSEP